MEKKEAESIRTTIVWAYCLIKIKELCYQSIRKD